MNTQHYDWICQSRQVIFQQCRTLSQQEMNQEHKFALNTIKETLLHITKCYRNWIGSYLLGHEQVFDFSKEEVAAMSFEQIEQLYAIVDQYVFKVMDDYKASMNELFQSKSTFKNDTSIQKTPEHLLFHAFTHECHHKGQITTMLTLLGYTPNNTNIILFSSK